MRSDLLLQLAEHLESGKLGHDHFNFGAYSIGPRKENLCGTHGCALGECSAIWPDEWYMRTMGGTISEYWEPVTRQGERFGAIRSAADFFDIEENEANNLFIPIDYRGDDDKYLDDPDEAEPNPWEEALVLGSATAAEVAASIRRFISWKAAAHA